MAKLTIFGSARIDAFLELPDDKANQVCSVDHKNCFIQLSYSAKIPLKRTSYQVGGNGANVAVGTKRLGIDNYLIAELGCGMMADYASKQLAKEIDMKYVTQSDGIVEGFGAVIVYQGERTILSYYSPARPPFPPDLPDSEWAYLTSIGDNFDEFYEDVYAWLTQTNAKLVFNPGGRQIKKGKEWLAKYLQRCELLMVNREEGEEIVSLSDTAGKERELLDALSAFGAKNVVVTDGMNGSYSKDSEGNYWQLGVLPIDSIERTGAGDSYSTGCMSALIKGHSLQEGMLWGTMNAASKVGYVGPQQGLLREDQLDEWIQRAVSSGVAVREL
jgi:sugar/nucleoside kinase (ribokinase family)